MFGVKDGVEVVERRAGVGRRRGIPRWLLAALAVLVIVGGFLAIRQLTAAEPAAAPQTVAVRRGEISSTVGATGSVIAQSTAKLSFKTSGRVAEVRVKPGDAVQAGQTLATLESRDLALQATQQRAALSSAQAKLANLKAGPRPEDLASARAAVTSAQAKLNQVTAGAQASDLRAAEQAVAAAQASLERARADLAKLKAGSSSQDIRNAELQLSQARNTYSADQKNRDYVCGQDPSPVLTEAQIKSQCDAAKAKVTSSSYSVSIAQNNLAKVKTPAKAEDIRAAEKAVSSAQAQLASAQAKLDQVKAGAKTDDVAIAEASLTQAQAQLALKQNPYTEADLQSAQAAVDQAQAQLELAELNLSNAAIVAPFAGVVSTVGIGVGELAGASSPAIVLVNPTDVRLDVNVDETDIARVLVGQKSSVTFDALPSSQFTGRVSAVAPSATIQSGVSTYLVSVKLDSAEGVRPGMTGSASIIYAEKADALLVPNRTIRRDGRSRTVEVLVGEKQEARAVTIGMTNDDESEILEGAVEGELVVIPTTTSFQFNMSSRPGGVQPTRAAGQ